MSKNAYISLYQNFGVQYAGVVSLLRAVLKVNLKTVREDTLMHDLKELG